LKILIVTHYFWPEQFRINDLAQALKERGHDVTVLTGMPNYPTGKLFPGYSWWKKRYDEMDGIPVYRTPMFLRRDGRGWQLALNYLSFVIFGCLLAPWYFRKHDFDVIFAYEPSPFTVAIPAILLRSFKKAPLFFWVQDLWPESLEAAGAVQSPILLKAVGYMVRWIYRRCDRVLVQSQAFIKPAVKAGAMAGSITYYPNWAEGFYKPLRFNEIDLQGVILPDGFRVIFAGNLGEAQSLETIIAASERLRCESKIQWIIIGDGRRAKWMQDEVTRLNLHGTVTFLGSYPAELMPHFFSMANLLLVTLKCDEVFSQTIPSKVQTYMACAKPIVAALNGEGARVIDEAEAGIAVEAEDDKALADAVLTLYRTSVIERENMGVFARAYYEVEFEREMLVDRLEAWMNQFSKEVK